MLFDTHAHILKKYYDNIEEIILEANKSDVKFIAIPATSIEDSKEIINTANSFENVYAMVGIHPENAKYYTDESKINDDLKILEDLAQDKKVIAIGEIGLDNYWTKEFKKEQKKLLISQINLANKLNLPVVLHIREATNDILDILKENPVKCGGIFHSSSFNEHLIKEGLKLGFYISFSGTVTFKNAKPDEAVKIVPDDRILIETDSPYLTPHPFRGKKNDPPFIRFTASKLASIRGNSFENICDITTKNAKKIFNIK